MFETQIPNGLFGCCGLGLAYTASPGPGNCQRPTIGAQCFIAPFSCVTTNPSWPRGVTLALYAGPRQGSRRNPSQTPGGLRAESLICSNVFEEIPMKAAVLHAPNQPLT